MVAVILAFRKCSGVWEGVLWGLLVLIWMVLKCWRLQGKKKGDFGFLRYQTCPGHGAEAVWLLGACCCSCDIFADVASSAVLLKSFVPSNEGNYKGLAQPNLNFWACESKQCKMCLAGFWGQMSGHCHCHIMMDLLDPGWMLLSFIAAARIFLSPWFCLQKWQRFFLLTNSLFDRDVTLIPYGKWLCIHPIAGMGLRSVGCSQHCFNCWIAAAMRSRFVHCVLMGNTGGIQICCLGEDDHCCVRRLALEHCSSVVDAGICPEHISGNVLWSLG